MANLFTRYFSGVQRALTVKSGAGGIHAEGAVAAGEIQRLGQVIPISLPSWTKTMCGSRISSHEQLPGMKMKGTKIREDSPHPYFMPAPPKRWMPL